MLRPEPAACVRAPHPHARRLAIGCVLLAAGCGPGGRGTRVVLVSLDTLRHDGLTADRMPRTFAWARRGLVFERHFAATSTTQPTHTSLFTGLHPWEHGVTRNGQVVPEQLDTIAERLQRAGYTTHGVVASFPLHAKLGYAQGFDHYVDEFTLFGSVKVWNDHEPDGFSTDAPHVLESARRLLGGARGPRQFFFVHFYDAHAPYGDSAGLKEFLTDELVLQAIAGGAPNPRRLIRRARKDYDLDLAALDGALGTLLDELMAATEFDTHVIVVSDHGESFGEDGSMGHGKRLSEAQLHVPLFVLSDRVEAGVREDPVGSVDVAKTVLSLAGVASADIAASDLLEDTRARGVFGMRRTFVEPFQETRIDGTVHTVSGHLFYAVDGARLLTGTSRGVSLGDLGGPPVEDARSAELRRLFGLFEDELSGAGTGERLDDETQEALRALGYAR